MKIKVSIVGRKAKIHEPYDYNQLLPYWSYAIPGFRFMNQGRWPGWDGRKKLFQRGIVPAGLFRATKDDIARELGIRFKIKHEPRYVAMSQKGLVSIDEYAFQNDVLAAMIQAIGWGGGLVLNATGSGKTRLAAMFFSRVKCSCVFLVDEVHLLEQARRELHEHLGEKIGIVGNSKFAPKRITVATVQTVHKHRNDLKFGNWLDDLSDGIMFIDEIHTQLNRRNWATIASIQPVAVFGLTATLELSKKPVRLNAWAVAGPVVYEYPVTKGMEEGVLDVGTVTRVVFKHFVERWRGQNMVEAYTDNIVHNDDRDKVICDLVKYGYKKGRYIVLIVERVKHLKHLSRLLGKIPHRRAYGHVEVSRRLKAGASFDAGKLRLIIANRVFKKGVNIKRIDMIVDAAAMSSANDTLQKFGRGLRRHASKRGMLYFDIADQDPALKSIKKANKKIAKFNRREKKLYDTAANLKPKLKPHRFHQAAQKRKRAYRKAGLLVQDVNWTDARTVFKAAVKLTKSQRKKIRNK